MRRIGCVVSNLGVMQVELVESSAFHEALKKPFSLRRAVSCLLCSRTLRAIGATTVLLASILLLGHLVLAHVSLQGDHGHDSQHTTELSQSKALKPTAVMECHNQVRTSSAPVAFFDAFQVNGHEATLDHNACEGIELDADCCGVSCHAAIGNRGIRSPTGCLPSLALEAARTTILDGRSQGPLERPPRVT